MWGWHLLQLLRPVCHAGLLEVQAAALLCCLHLALLLWWCL
jgi:hypothetical protein